MAFRKKYREITRLNPDILVIQECENDDKLKAHFDGLEYNQIYWHGNNIHKGIAVISFNDAEVTPKSNHSEEYKYIVPFELRIGNKKINLFCVWAMDHKTESIKRYIGQVWGAVNYYSDDLDEPSILIGDLNSNAIWDTKKRIGNHTDVVNFLRSKRMSSVYHTCNDCRHGEENDPTLFLLKKESKPYHIDYCFVPDSMLSNQTKISIGEYSDWIRLSDHMPIIIDGLKI